MKKKNIYKFMSAGFEICVIIFSFFLIGIKIDEKFKTKYYGLILSCVGIFFALYILLKKVKKGWKINDKKVL